MNEKNRTECLARLGEIVLELELLKRQSDKLMIEQMQLSNNIVRSNPQIAYTRIDLNKSTEGK